jgi:hypothetical protein
MLNFIKNIFNPTNNFKIQSFTFFIPAPPPRPTGYREKHFDRIFYDFINRGYEILSMTTQSFSGTNQSGMWIVCVVRALNAEANKLNFDDFALEMNSQNRNEDKIDGLYYLTDEKK